MLSRIILASAAIGVLLLAVSKLLQWARFLFHFCRIPVEWASMEFQGLGFALKLIGLSEAERFRVIQGFSVKYPKVTKFLFGPLGMIFIQDPEMIQKVLVCTDPAILDKPFVYDFFGWGDGLITARYATWKPHRKILNGAFGLKFIQDFVPIFDQCSKSLSHNIGKHVGQESFSVLQYSVQSTLDAICATSFGISVKAHEKNLGLLNSYLHRLNELVAVRLFNLHFFSDSIFRLSKYWQQDQEARNFCFKYSDQLVRKRRQALKQLDENSNLSPLVEDDDGFCKKANIFVDHLIKNEDAEGNPTFTDPEIRDHALTTLSAGSETTGLAISMTLIFLAMHPEYQEKAFQEVQEFFRTNERLTYENVSSLPYIDMVIKESLRLSPSAPMMSRYVNQDITLGDMFLPKGTVIIIGIALIHRLPQYFGPEANKFNPDNFLPENVAKRHSFSYIPFSAGVRNCIGQKYAMVSLKVMLVNLLRTFKFATPLKMEDLEYRADITLMITNPYLLQVQRR